MCALCRHSFVLSAWTLIIFVTSKEQTIMRPRPIDYLFSIAFGLALACLIAAGI